MHPRLIDLAVHLARLSFSALALALAARAGVPWMIVAAALLFLEAFSFMHDLSHGALRLPRRVNEIALAVSGALLLMSGHALRRMHLRHHARALADDDFEGLPARGTFLHALWIGPRAAIALRIHAFGGAGRRGQLWQIVETAVDAALLIALVASGRPALCAYAAVALVAQITMSVWAAHIPHNAPAWLTGAAARLAWTGSPTALSLAFHALHHAHPEVPCRRLADAARGACGA